GLQVRSPSHWRYVRSRPSTICEQLLEWLQRLRWLRFHQVARRQRRHEIRFHYRATADVTDGAVEAGFLAVRRANALSRPRRGLRALGPGPGSNDSPRHRILVGLSVSNVPLHPNVVSLG